jgi:hypothetical protein
MSLAGNVKKVNLNMACGLFLIVFDGTPLPLLNCYYGIANYSKRKAGGRGRGP